MGRVASDLLRFNLTEMAQALVKTETPGAAMKASTQKTISSNSNEPKTHSHSPRGKNDSEARKCHFCAHDHVLKKANCPQGIVDSFELKGGFHILPETLS